MTIQAIEAEQLPDIDDLRQEIDRLDAAILEAVKRRTEVSKLIGKARMASGGTRLVLRLGRGRLGH
jgi:chorismate mutase